MKKLLLTLSVVLMSVGHVLGLSHSAIRENARFLSDRMAYELDMTPMQYDDCYEVNYDFIYAINAVMDDVVMGYPDAIDRYYRYLDNRNDDFRYILSSAQYRRFMALDYFYRPIYTYAGNWLFRVFQVYNNHSFFYLDAPRVYHNYHGEHSRSHHTHGYYVGSGHYHHQVYDQHRPIYGSDYMHGYSRSDFGHNRRERGDRYPSNNYNNRNQHDRMSDPRYHDDRRDTNRNTPDINGRGHNNSGHSNSGNANSGHGNGGHSNNSDANRGHGNGGHSNGSNANSGHGNGGHSNGGNTSNGHSNGGNTRSNGGGNGNSVNGRSVRH